MSAAASLGIGMQCSASGVRAISAAASLRMVMQCIAEEAHALRAKFTRPCPAVTRSLRSVYWPANTRGGVAVARFSRASTRRFLGSTSLIVDRWLEASTTSRSSNACTPRACGCGAGVGAGAGVAGAQAPARQVSALLRTSTRHTCVMSDMRR